MIKYKFRVVLVVLLMIALLIPQTSFAAQKLSVKLNGEIMKTDTELYSEKGRIMVPIKGIFDKMGLDIKQEKDKIYVEDKYTAIEFTIDNKQTLIHRKYDFTGIPEKVELDAAPKLVNNIAYIPIRFTAEVFNIKVEWNGKERAVLLSDNTINPVETSAAYSLVNVSSIQADNELKKWYEGNYKKEGIHYKKVNGTTYVILSAGEKPTGGYSIEVESATIVSPGSVYITAKVNKPSPDMMVTQAITYPAVMIKLEAKDINKVDGVLN